MTGRVIKRAYKYRFYPAPDQETELRRTFGCVRLVYNRALEARTTAWYGQQRRVSYAETSAMLTAWKREPELGFLSEVSSVPLQQTLRHLQGAFVNFWEKRAKYPTFKSRKKSRASAEYTRSAFRFRDGQLTLAKMTEPLAIVWSRPLPEGAEPSTVTVSVDPAGRWHVSILVETTVECLPSTGRMVGVDAGIMSLVTLSTGEKVANPRHERRDRERLARAQRELARKVKGSANRAKARLGGRDLVVVDRWYPSSKVCSACGFTAASMPLNVREWTCANCGVSHDRDVNAARNLLAAGRAVTACGDGVRPTRRSARHLSKPPHRDGNRKPSPRGLESAALQGREDVKPAPRAWWKCGR